MDEWKTTPMGALCSIKNGKSNTEDAVEDGPYAFFDRSKQVKRSSKYLFDCEALIIPGEGTEFLPKEYRGKFDLHQRAYALYEFKDIDPKYLYYFLIHSKDYWPRVAVGATVKSLRLRHFEDLPVTHPPLLEQQRIITKLDAAFAALAEAQAHVERNRANARELFESYLNGVFEGKDWEMKRLQDVSLQFGRGKSKHRPRNDDRLYGGPYPFIQTGDVRNSDHVITSYSQTYSEFGLAQSKLWPKGTLCITIAANIAETAVLGFDACFPDSVIGMVADPKQCDIHYVEFLLQSFKTLLKAQGKGSAQDNINLGTFENQAFPFPPLAEQRKLANALDAVLERSRQLESTYQQKLLDLEGLKKGLLGSAFRGEL